MGWYVPCDGHRWRGGDSRRRTWVPPHRLSVGLTTSAIPNVACVISRQEAASVSRRLRLAIWKQDDLYAYRGADALLAEWRAAPRHLRLT